MFKCSKPAVKYQIKIDNKGVKFRDFKCSVTVRLSAVRKMVFEARKNGMIGAEEAANLTEVPNIPQKGTRLGNWLTREQAKELLAVPDRSTLKGKRDYVILAVLVGCALRREELAVLDVDTIQLREGRWVLVDLEGKGRRVRTVAVPVWVKQGINAWMTAAGVEDGRLLRAVYQKRQSQREHERLGGLVGGRAVRQTDRDRAVRERTTCAAPAPSSAGRMAAAWNRSSFCWGTPRSRRPNAISGPSRISRRGER